MNKLIKFKELQEITGYKRASDIEGALKAEGIACFHGKDNTVWTTLDIINAAGGLVPKNDERKITL